MCRTCHRGVGFASFRSDPDIRHIGPVAQDFHAAFGVGADDKHIAAIDRDGVALAAIQALNTEVTRLRQEATAWQGSQRSEVSGLREENSSLRAELRELATRLAALEKTDF